MNLAFLRGEDATAIIKAEVTKENLPEAAPGAMKASAIEESNKYCQYNCYRLCTNLGRFLPCRLATNLKSREVLNDHVSRAPGAQF